MNRHQKKPPRKKPRPGTPKESTKKPSRKPALVQLLAIAHDLLPVAAGQARQKRPRLLAVCARIILSARRIKLAADTQTIGGVDTDDLDTITGNRRATQSLNEAKALLEEIHQAERERDFIASLPKEVRPEQTPKRPQEPCLEESTTPPSDAAES
jgi:hypothetical protein